MSTSTDIEEPVLSAEQVRAVESDCPAIVVVASAGSGKTEVVARRIQRLLKMPNDDQGRVLALTYTIKAADELRARLDARLGSLARRVESDTVHGFSHSLLRTYGTRLGLPAEPELLVRDEDRVELITNWLESQGQPAPDDIRPTLAQLDLARARGGETALLHDWEAALAGAGALDYPALLLAAKDLLDIAAVRRQVRRLYTAVVVDEAQNLTQSQYELLIALVQDGERVAIPTMLVGDDKQSIVSFAGADPRFLGRFAQDFSAERFALTANFRSAHVLSAAASQVAAALGHHVADSITFAARGVLATEELADERQEGERIAAWVQGLLDSGLPAGALGDSEQTAVRPEDIAVLARASAGLRHVAAALEVRNIPFALSSAPDEWLSTTAGRLVLELVGLRGSPQHRSTYWEISRLRAIHLSRLRFVRAYRARVVWRGGGPS